MLASVVIGASLASPQRSARSIGNWWDITPGLVTASALVLVAGLGLIAMSWVLTGRDRVYTLHPHRGWAGGVRGLLVGETIVPEYEPPAGLTAGEVGLVTDGCAEPRHVSATLVDLAIRGLVRIEELSGSGWVVERLKTSQDELRPFEQALLALLFRTRARVDLTDTGGPFYLAVVGSEIELDQIGVTQGWFRTDPAQVRRHWRLVGLGLAAAGLVTTAALGMRAGAGFVGASIIVAGIALFIAAGSMHVRTALGHQLMLRSLGFRRYMETAEAGRQRFAEREDLFTRYLPFAVAFGIATKWAHRFNLAGTVYASHWYRPRSSGELGHVQLADGLSRFSSHVDKAYA